MDKSVSVFCVIVLALLLICDPTRAIPSLRGRRQGWEWGEGNNFDPDSNSNQQRPPTPRPTFPTGPPPPFTTTTSANQVAENSGRVAQCIASCPATPQYNPVCGTDNQNYNNEGRLNCAKNCGQTVELLHLGTCAPNS